MANLRQYAPLATAAEVIAQSFTNANTDPYLISDDTIVLAELAHFKPILGDDFYGELKLQNDTGALSTENQELMTYYLIPALCWMTRFEVIVEIQNNSTSAGVVTNIDEFADAVSSDELNVYRQSTYRKGDLFITDMMSFITGTDQAGDFPTFDANNPCTWNEVWKNHGIIMYDSIYDRKWCNTCTNYYYGGNCNCGCGNC